jgi:hypothetical protein
VRRRIIFARSASMKANGANIDKKNNYPNKNLDQL